MAQKTQKLKNLMIKSKKIKLELNKISTELNEVSTVTYSFKANSNKVFNQYHNLIQNIRDSNPKLK